MEVLDAQEAVLCNNEVLTFLQEQRAQFAQRKPGGAMGGGGSVATLMLETLSALESTPAKDQDPESVKTFMAEVESFNLTQLERLMLLNQCPQTDVEIHLLVEESEERLSEEQIQQLLQIIRRVLLKKEDEEEGEENEEPGDEENGEEDVEEEDKSSWNLIALM